jgi:oligopeptide transport system ATP-binding protein
MDPLPTVERHGCPRWSGLTAMPDPLLEVSALRVHFPVNSRVFSRRKEVVRAVDGVSFTIEVGETLGLVGESGCGKTTVGRAVVRLVKPTAGSVRFENEDLAALTNSELRARRRRFQMIFQDPYGSLDPRLTVSEIIAEALDIHRLAATPAARRARIEGLLKDVGLEAGHAQRYPHEFSGGQRQRIGIARALAVEPKLIVCDEPVSALDVSVQAQIINLLQDLQRQYGLAYLFIGHDLAVVRHISRRMVVMYLGSVMETGDSDAVCRQPKHPYTQALISAVPVVDPALKKRRIVLAGEVPSAMHPPSGCPFHPRCPVAEGRCKTERPALRNLGEDRFVACHLAT